MLSQYTALTYVTPCARRKVRQLWTFLFRVVHMLPLFQERGNGNFHLKRCDVHKSGVYSKTMPRQVLSVHSARVIHKARTLNPGALSSGSQGGQMHARLAVTSRRQPWRVPWYQRKRHSEQRSGFHMLIVDRSEVSPLT